MLNGRIYAFLFSYYRIATKYLLRFVCPYMKYLMSVRALNNPSFGFAAVVMFSTFDNFFYFSSQCKPSKRIKIHRKNTNKHIIQRANYIIIAFLCNEFLRWNKTISEIRKKVTYFENEMRDMFAIAFYSAPNANIISEHKRYT